MINLIYGNYDLQKNDVIVNEISYDSLRRNFMNKDSNFVAYSDDLKLTKNDLDEIIDMDVDLTIVIHDRKLIKGKRKETKKYKLTISAEDQESSSVNSFELAKLIFSCKDRDMLFQYLKDSKGSLYVTLMSLSCNVHKFYPENQKIVLWLCKNYYRIKYDIVCAMIAYKIKVQQVPYLDWLYPKKEKKEE